jgi:hypothetical protein
MVEVERKKGKRPLESIFDNVINTTYSTRTYMAQSSLQGPTYQHHCNGNEISMSFGGNKHSNHRIIMFKFFFPCVKYKLMNLVKTKHLTNNKMTGNTSYLSILMLNINGLNSPIKRQRIVNCINKQDPPFLAYKKCLLKTKTNIGLE